MAEGGILRHSDAVYYEIWGDGYDYSTGQCRFPFTAIEVAHRDNQLIRWQDLHMRIYTYVHGFPPPSIRNYSLVDYCRVNISLYGIIVDMLSPPVVVDWRQEGF